MITTKLIISILYGLLITSTILLVLFDNGSTGKKVAWLLVLTLIPGIGVILYILFGINYRHNWYFKRDKTDAKTIFENFLDPKIKEHIFSKNDFHDIDERFKSLAHLLNNYPGTAVHNKNNIEIISSGKTKYSKLLEDMENAKKSIHVEYFLFDNSKGSQDIRKMLMKKALEGVEVRFIHENIANITIPPMYYTKMRRAGVQVVRFNNPHKHIFNLITRLNYRNHRKIVVIDNTIAYTGGMNIGDNYFLKWRDTHMRLEGPCVNALQYIFLDSWITSGGKIAGDINSYFNREFPIKQGENIDIEKVMQYDLDKEKPQLTNKLIQIVPDEPNSLWPLIQMSYEWILNNVNNYIYIQTPYFVPPEPILNALQSAALRGVDVRIMIPKKPDSFFMGYVNKSYFGECLDAGIKIYEREERFIHSKTFVADDYVSCIGTANVDFRSFDINYEVNTYIYDKDTALINKSLFLKDLALSKEVKKSSWDKRHWYQNIGQHLIRIFAPLL